MMRHAIVLGGLYVFLAGSVLAQGDERGVRHTLELFTKAVNEGDVKVMRSLTTPQTDNRGMGQPGDIVTLVCWEAKCEDLAPQSAKYDVTIKKIRFINTDTVVADTDTVVESQGKRQTIFGFWLLYRRDGSWKIESLRNATPRK